MKHFIFNKRFIIYALLLVSALAGAAIAMTSSSHQTDSDTPQTIFVSSGDAKIFCRISGKAKPLIVIHGGPGLTQDYLLPQMDELAKNNLVVFYDQRGCGKSTGEINTDTITLESFVHDIEAIQKQFHWDKISILGHSWGGFLAMHYAISHQDHMDKLILSNSAPATSEGYALFEQEYLRRMKPIQNDIDKILGSQEFRDGDPKVTEQFYRLLFRQYCYIPEKADLLNLWMTSTAILNGAKVSKILQENVLNQPFNLNKDLNSLKIPTLVIHGDVDPIPPITAKNIHENLPNSSYILMENCGHFPYVENPTLYFEHINNFLHPKHMTD